MSLTPLGTARRWMTGYWATAAIHLIAVALDLRVLRMMSKVALMPSLASWVRSQQGPPLLIAALLASALGDLLLEFDLLLPAMATFATAHVCYIAVFSRGQDRRPWQVLGAYAVLWLVVMLALWPGLGVYRAPAAVYAVMLTATAVTSLWHGSRTGLGGALFLASDALIGAGLAGHDFPLRCLLVKTAYGAGQYQIATALTRAAVPTGSALTGSTRGARLGPRC